MKTENRNLRKHLVFAAAFAIGGVAACPFSTAWLQNDSGRAVGGHRFLVFNSRDGGNDGTMPWAPADQGGDMS